MWGCQRNIFVSCLCLMSLSCGSSKFNFVEKKTTAKIQLNNEGHSESLSSVQAKRSKLKVKKEKAILDGDLHKEKKIQIELNYYLELENALKKDSQDDVQLVVSKYKTIRKIFSESVASFGEHNKFNSLTKHDNPYSEPYIGSYNEQVLEQVLIAFEDFGDLYINSAEDSHGRAAMHNVNAKKPWSGYWYPFRDRSLYNSDTSPLVKLDMVNKAVGRHSKIANWERDTFGKYTADGWEGLCDALALAAVLSPEPKKSKYIKGVKFSISDLKALLIVAHSKYPYKQYGITYRGTADTDGTYEDIKPEAFHRIVTKVLGEENRALIIDETAGVEVWNKPLYSYSWKVQQDPQLDNAFLVKAYAKLVNQRRQASDVLTNLSDTTAPTYEYRLYVDKNVVKDGKYRVVAGQWLGASRNYHPGNVKYPILNAEPVSHNLEFNKTIDVYKKYFR